MVPPITSKTYINKDLVEAVRDSVHIKPSSSSSSLLDEPQSILLNNDPAPLDTMTSASGMPGHQPDPPSSRMRQLQNPFDEDEVDPADNGRMKPPEGGLEDVQVLQPRRAKFTKAHTGAAASISSSSHLLASSPDTGKVRPKRSMSIDSHGIPVSSELTAGQRKGTDEKKGSRHVDVIDTWDPTGLGSAMWHHAGPYDAAAPSRNTNLPNTKAPMRAFDKTNMQLPLPLQRGPSTISLTPPVPPAKESSRDTVEADRRRPSRAIPARRAAGGGLTGQYSTSMPTDGGYFPNLGDAGPQDEAGIARMERQREREAKRMALKAAWGIDTPEPFEDFGGSPHDGTLDSAEDAYSPESTTAPLPGGRPIRSPTIKEETLSPVFENALPRGSTATSTNAPPGGIKRTKSLMQKIKTMRKNPNVLARKAPHNPRPSSPSREPSPMPSEAASDESALTNEKHRLSCFIGKPSDIASPKKSAPPASAFSSSTQTDATEQSNLVAGSTDQKLSLSNKNSALNPLGINAVEPCLPESPAPGYEFVESPSSKTRALRALQREANHHARSASQGMAAPSPSKRSQVKPPVAPVLPPDLDDFWSQKDRTVVAGENRPENEETKEVKELKRSTSLVKKMKEKIRI
ncbi:hypothetical protein L204_101553 [Cryptococcus depauperatus]